MKKGKRYLLLSIFIIVLSLYTPGTAAAMETGAPSAEQEPEPVSESETEPKPTPGAEQQPNLGTEPETGLGQQPETEPAAGQEPVTEPKQEPETGQESETEPKQELATEPDAESDMALMAVSQTDEEPDGISSASELVNWLESHKYSGGRAALTGDITIKEPYMFVPYPNMPPLSVETGRYTIFVCADTEFWSDGRLTFVGEGGEKGIFHVEQGGMLLLDGVAVETAADGGGSKYALWQEEGAGMILGNTFVPCHVSGKVHYAETPLVMDTEHVCVVVEKGELPDGRLPAEVKCKVNAQGAILEQEPVAVSWNMEGTENQQAQRLRFRVQGTLPQAVDGLNPVCTVVYHDFPLTFTEEKAFVRGNAYTFQGDYIRQEGAAAAAVLPEYSFDGENWIREGENEIFRADSGYYIAFPCDQWDVSSNPYIYIRLRGETEEQVYYSNVLRYAANNMGAAEDLGGSRGGGTAIVNPPAEPENPPGPEKPVEPEEPVSTEKPEEPKKPVESPESAKQEKADGSTEPDRAADPEKTPEPAKREQADLPTVPDKTADPDKMPEPTEREKRNESTVSDKAAKPDKTSEPAEAEKGKTAAAISRQPNQEDESENNSSYAQTAESGVTLENTGGSTLDLTVQTANYGLMVGIVVLSAAAGAVCFFVSKGTKR